jgi:uncharacterized protein DUF559/transcriptional regulator with AbiEi antitoxin domain of type IV toxin-antitoxin system
MRCGATKGVIRWRLKVGRWERLHPCVYRSGSPITWRQEAIAACLYLGSPTMLSHRAAAFARGSSRFRRPKLEVTVPRKRHRAQASRIIIHWTEEPIPEEDITTIDGIPVTKPARTLLDLATVEPGAVVARCLDEALRRRLVSLPFLDRWLDDAGRKRHRGHRMLRKLVDERATIGVTESELETSLLPLIKEAGLPLPMLQYEVWDGERLVGRVDFAYPDERVAIEADGFQFHDRRDSFDSERARGNALEALGWRVLRITSKHIEEYPNEVADWIARALAAKA